MSDKTKIIRLFLTIGFLILLSLVFLKTVSHIHDDLRFHPDCIYCKLDSTLMGLFLFLPLALFSLFRSFFSLCLPFRGFFSRFFAHLFLIRAPPRSS